MIFRVKGLTLIELLVALVIAGILFGLGLPRVDAMIQQSRHTAAANHLVGSLQYARQESLRLQGPVSLCPSRDGERCHLERSAWQHGWIIYQHRQNRGNNRLRDSDQILRVVDQAPGGLKANRQRFTMRTDGRRSTNGSFLICPEGARQAERAVIVNVMGRPRVARETNRMPSPHC